MQKFPARILHIGLVPYRTFRTFSLKKKIVTIIVLIILFFVISGIVTSATKEPPYTTETVTRSDIVEIVSESGNIDTGGSVPIHTPTNGIVTDVFTKNGEFVEKGQELFTVESSATEQEERAAYASYLTAVAGLDAAKSNLNTLRATMYQNWDSFRDLATNGEYEDGDNNPREENREAAEFQISQDNWQAAEAKYKDQQTVVGQAQAQVSSTWLLYQATQNATVNAPIAGTVSNLSITTGKSVTINTPTAIPTKPTLTLADFSNTEAVITVSDEDINKIKEGQKVTIEIDAIDDKQYRGSVSRVDTIATDVQGVMLYSVYISILDADDRILPGMTLDAEIVTNELTDVLSVSNSAVKPYEGKRAVRVPGENGEVEFIPITVGIRGDDKTEIKKGLTEGQTIITTLSSENTQQSNPLGF